MKYQSNLKIISFTLISFLLPISIAINPAFAEPNVSIEMKNKEIIETEKFDIAILEFSVKNLGTKSLELYGDILSLKDSQSRSFDWVWYTDYERCKQLRSNINPGISEDITLCFEIPKDISLKWSLVHSPSNCPVSCQTEFPIGYLSKMKLSIDQSSGKIILNGKNLFPKEGVLITILDEKGKELDHIRAYTYDGEFSRELNISPNSEKVILKVGYIEIKDYPVSEISLTVKRAYTHPLVTKSSIPSITESEKVFNTDMHVKYGITGGEVLSITAYKEFKSLVIPIATTSDGMLTIALPRALIDAKITAEEDDNFFVLADGAESDFSETETTSTERTLEIPFTDGTTEIEIVGTEIVGRTDYATPPTPSIPPAPSIPSWVKNNAKWWAEEKISDSDFSTGIEFLIKEKIIKVPETKKSGTETVQKIPEWIKNNAGWWANGLITEDDFVKGIEYLVKVGIIRVQ